MQPNGKQEVCIPSVQRGLESYYCLLRSWSGFGSPMHHSFYQMECLPLLVQVVGRGRWSMLHWLHEESMRKGLNASWKILYFRKIHIGSFKGICSHSPINACWRSVGDRTILGSASQFLFNNSHIWQVNSVKSLPRTGSRSTKQTSHFQDCINSHGLSAIAVKMAC